MADIKSMTLAEAKAYRSELKRQGKEPSTSKEFGKLEDYIKTLQPEKYGEDTVQSAYEKLSSGVTETGGWTEANLSELNRRGIYPNLQYPDQMGAAGADGDINSYLSGFQDSVYGAAGSPELRDQISAQLEPEGAAYPEALNRVEKFEDYRDQYGVADLESSLNDLKAQIREEYAVKRQRTQAAEGKPVAMGVIAGRVTEIERQEAERIDALNREAAYINDQLTTAYGAIEMYMNFENMDYQDAVSRYNDEFNRNLQIYKLVDEEMDQREATARANLQTFANAITSGNLTYNDLSSSQKTQINKLEVQSRMPIGFIGSLGLSPQDRIIATSSDKSQVTILNDDGTFTTKSTGIAPKSSGSGSSSGSGYNGETISTNTNYMLDAIKYVSDEIQGMGVEFQNRTEDYMITDNRVQPLIDWWVKNSGRSEADWWTRFGKYVVKK